MSSILKKIILSVLAAGGSVHAFAEQAAPAAADTDFTVGSHSILLACACLLFVVICSLGTTLRSAVLFYHQKKKKEAADKSQGTLLPGLLLLFVCCSFPALAQDAAAPASVGDAEMLPWVLYIVLGIEILIILLFAKLIRFFTGVEAFRQAAHQEKPRRFRLAAFWTKINKLKPIEEEASLDTGHSYDGIRELDNATPPWFIAGFTLSILFAAAYMWRYHVAQSAPLQEEEYSIAVAEAKARIDEYLKTQANNVDENTVVVLGADGIAAGQALFASNCVACHGDKGRGASVGPNLSDKYWLHQGSIKDIFKSIKYGWQEKGMKAWKDDFSPTQIAQLASYVHSLKGSDPAGAKEPQGELYEESTQAVTATADTVAQR